MKTLHYALTMVVISAISVVNAAEAPQEPTVTLTPFEPPYGECYKWEDKFSHPDEIVAPRFLYPFEMRRSAIDGEVSVLVQIDAGGYPKRLSILYSTLDEFSRAAVLALKKARWKPGSIRPGQLGVWFYYKAVYRIDEQPNQISEGNKQAGE